VGDLEESLNLPLVTAIAPVVKISFIRGKQYKQKCTLVLNFLLGGKGGCAKCTVLQVLFVLACYFVFLCCSCYTLWYWKSLCNDIVNPVYRGARRKHLNLPPFKLCYSTNKSLCAVLTNLGQHTGSH